MSDAIRRGFPFPSGGVQEATSFQASPMGMSPRMLNVWPWDVKTGRLRGGKRGGTAKAYPEELGGGEPVRMLAELGITGSWSTKEINDFDDFNRPDDETLGEGWVAAIWTTPYELSIEDNRAKCGKKNNLSADTRSAAPVFSLDLPYSIKVGIRQGNSSTGKKEHVHLYARMDTLSPDIEDEGIDADLFIEKQDSTHYSYRGSLTVIHSGTAGTPIQFVPGNVPIGSLPLVYKLTVDGDHVTVTLGAIALLTEETVTGQTGAGVGFGVLRLADAYLNYNNWRLEGALESITPSTKRTIQFASAGGTLSVEDEDGVLVANTDDAGVFSADHSFAAVEIGQKLVLCDYGAPRVYGSDGTIGATIGAVASAPTAGGTGYTVNDILIVTEGTGGKVKVTAVAEGVVTSVELNDSGTDGYTTGAGKPTSGGTGADCTVNITALAYDVLTATDVSDWTIYSIDPDTDVLVLSNSDGPTDGVYEIDTIVAGKVTLTDSAVEDGSCTYRIETAPKVYAHGATPALSILTAAATKGQVPIGCRLACRYAARLVLGGGPDDRDWYMSRAFDATDWEYGAAGSNAACSGHSSEANKVPDILRALIPFTDDYLIFGCMGSVWRLNGNPVEGGRIQALSYDTGVLDANAYCYGPDGRIFFLAPDGLYQIPPGGTVQYVSQGKLPRALAEIDTNTQEVFLSWEPEHTAVGIFIVSRVDATSVHYLYDLRTQGFSPITVPSAQGPTAVYLQGRRSSQVRRLLLGGRDGYVRTFDRDAKGDDGTAINSYVDFAPQVLGFSDARVGIIHRLDAILAEDSGTVDWELRTGPTAEAAYRGRVAASGQWFGGGPSVGGGKQKTVRTRVRGAWGVMRLSNAVLGETWAVEQIAAEIITGGRVR